MDVSIDNIRKTIEELCKFENRIAGTKMEHDAAKYLIDRLSEYGFPDIIQHKFPVISWNPREASLTIVSPTEKTIDCTPMPYTTSVEERVRLVDMNSENEQKTDKHPVFGLTEWGPNIYGAPTVAYNKALDMGLDGVIVSSPVEGDMLKVLVVARGDELQIPVFSISKEDGDSLRKMIDESEVVLDVRAVVEKRKSDSSNIEVVLQGSEPDYDIVIGGHYDAWFSGAADNAAPVAVVVEVARLLKESVDNGDTLKRTVRFLLYGAEESGTNRFFFWVNGSREYVQSRETLDDIGLVVSLDSVGYNAPNYIVSTHETSGFAKTLTETIGHEDRFVHWSPPGYGSDHWFFTSGGVPTIYLIPWPSDLYHTQKDTPEILDYDSIQAFAEYSVGAVSTFANAIVLPFDIIYQTEQLQQRVQEYSRGKGNPLDLQSVLKHLADIRELKPDFDNYKKATLESDDKERISEFNSILRKVSGKLNRTIGLLLPVKGESQAKHLPNLDLITDIVALDSIIKSLGKMPIMDISPRTRSQFSAFEDTPVSWIDVEKPIEALREERERMIKMVTNEVEDFLVTVKEIQSALEKLLKS